MAQGPLRRIQEIQRTLAAFPGADIRVEEDDIDEDFFVVVLPDDVADVFGIYTHLSVSPRGTVAEYTINQPQHFATFADLLQAAKGANVNG